MNTDKLLSTLLYMAENSRSKHDVLIAAVNLIKSQQSENADLKQLLAAKEKSLKGSMSLNGEATERIETLILKLAESRRETQAAEEDIPHDCATCLLDDECYCLRDMQNGRCKNWKWRGPQEAGKGDNK